MDLLECKYLTWFKHQLFGYGSVMSRGVYRISSIKMKRPNLGSLAWVIRSCVRDNHGEHLLLSYYNGIDRFEDPYVTIVPV